ncbi:MAG: hypothetical protein JWP21_1060, partial [Tardiphaga sp.]|nr:hypothetical protein [Tardiphaga sp.]
DRREPHRARGRTGDVRAGRLRLVPALGPQIAPIYNKTDEAKLLPLRRIDIDRDKPTDLALASPVIYTPTFIVIDNGHEIGRINGYINDESFWGLLGKFAAQLHPSRERS